mgnify:CR=1 FL=1
MFPGIVPKASPEIERVIAVVSSEPVWLIWLARAHRPVGRPRQPGRPTGRPTWLAACTVAVAADGAVGAVAGGRPPAWTFGNASGSGPAPVGSAVP